jgi:hypothetical protein
MPNASIAVAAARACFASAGRRETADIATSRPVIAGSATPIQGVPSWSAAATHARLAPLLRVNPSGSTWYQVYPDASTGPPMTWSSVPSGRSGSYLTESSLTRGSDLMRTSPLTVLTTAPRNASLEPDGLEAGDEDGTGDPADGVADGVRFGPADGEGEVSCDPQAATASATTRSPTLIRRAWSMACPSGSPARCERDRALAEPSWPSRGAADRRWDA